MKTVDYNDFVGLRYLGPGMRKRYSIRKHEAVLTIVRKYQRDTGKECEVTTTPPSVIVKRLHPDPDKPWDEMFPDDTVFFPDEPSGVRSGPAQRAQAYGGKTGQVFVAKARASGVRIWRVE